MDEYDRELQTERSMKDQFMARHPESPFVSDNVPGFERLHYFPASKKFRVPAHLERLDRPAEAYLRTNRDGEAVMRHVGDMVFSVDGRRLRLRVYHAGEGVGNSVFIPFRDATSGSDTYGPGRYLTVELTENDDYELDFNRAFNPYCAYTDAYECGFPPAENDLPVAIRAGEKVWSADRNPATPSSAVLELIRKPKSKNATPPALTSSGGSSRKKAPRARTRSPARKKERR